MAAEGPSLCGYEASRAKGAQRVPLARVFARFRLTDLGPTWKLTERGPIWPKSGLLIVKSWYISDLLGMALKDWTG